MYDIQYFSIRFFYIKSSAHICQSPKKKSHEREDVYYIRLINGLQKAARGNIHETGELGTGKVLH